MIDKTRISAHRDPTAIRTGVSTSEPTRVPIAIIGLGCRLPGRVSDAASFWKILSESQDVVTQVPPERWSERHFYHPQRGKPGKTQARWGGFVEGIDLFDAQTFGISPREAARMDPQQRMLLETAWEALEDGGQVFERLAGSKTAVFVGISSWDYTYQGLSFSDRGVIDAYSNTGSSHSIAANRISYCFDLRGPSSAVDTACSSALLAVHLACQAIWYDQCPLALAGGVNSLLLPDFFIAFSQLSMLSPTGRCRAFDAAADGFVRSEGAGMVLLKPLDQALADRDRIYAVIRGSHVNQDGRTPGMTVPSQEAQQELVAAACRSAGVLPSQIDYVEAHGTGTLVGDPIEARAIGTVLGAERSVDHPCILGSVKTNIGHLEAGAGIASLLKVSLAMHYESIPANLHFSNPNPEIDFKSLRLRVPVVAEPWPRSDDPRWAGINAFGYGGTNVHLILQDAPVRGTTTSRISPNGDRTRNHANRLSTLSQPRPSEGEAQRIESAGSDPWGLRAQLIPISARSPQALSAALQSIPSALRELPPSIPFVDWAGNMVHRRSHHDYRTAIVAGSRDELIAQLEAMTQVGPSAIPTPTRVAPGTTPRLAFVCSGQGPQWWGMGQQLLEEEPVFREMIQRCDRLVQQLGFWSLWDELTAEEEMSNMADTAISQPAIFALQVALAALWRSWGVQPVAVVGHSVGEVAAAYLAGIFSLEDAVRIIYQRGRCMGQASKQGRMLAAGLTLEEAEAMLHGLREHVTIAAINSPSSVTFSGAPSGLEKIASQLSERNVFHRHLHVEYAFHSAQMEPIRIPLLESLQGIRPRQAKLPMLSTVTCLLIDGPELGPEYWWHNVRDCVQFAAATQQLADQDVDFVVELSPHPVLAAAVSETFQERSRSVTVLPSLRRGDDERVTMLGSAGALHSRGFPLHWSELVPAPRQFVPLLSYRWQRDRLWFESDDCRTHRHPIGYHPLLGSRRDGPRFEWQNRIDLRALSYLTDHRVEGTIVYPAAAFVETALSAAAEVTGTETFLVEDLRLTAPLVLTSDEAYWIESDYQEIDKTLRVHGRLTNQAAAWTLHCTSRLRPASEMASPSTEALEAIRSRCENEFSQKRCYEYCAALGLEYGSAFQGITHGWYGQRESLACVELPETIRTEGGDYCIHPALLDACFQAMIVADDDFDDFVGPLYLPVEIARIQLLQRPQQRAWVHARIRDKSSNVLTADLEIRSETGELQIRIEGFVSRRTAGKTYREKLSELLFEYQWQRSDTLIEPAMVLSCESDAPSGSAQSAGESLPVDSSAQRVDDDSMRDGEHWLILADKSELGRRLADKLTAREATCMVVLPGTEFRELGPDCYSVNSADRTQMNHMMEHFVLSYPTSGRGLIHLESLDAPAAKRLNGEKLSAWRDRGTISLLHLVQAWDAVVEKSIEKGSDLRSSDNEDAPSRNGPARLLVVTRGAQAVTASERVEVAQSPVIGLTRVLVSEYAGLETKLIDLDPAEVEPDENAIEKELILGGKRPGRAGDPDDEDEVAWRNSKRYVHRFLPSPATTISAADATSPFRLGIDQPGTLDGLQFQTVKRRAPDRNEVEIEVAAGGLNFSDVMKGLGLYPGVTPGTIRLGAECSGVITRVGADVEGLQIGDEVLAVASHAFASHVTTPASLVARKPSSLRLEEAAAVPIPFLTAYYAMEYLGRLQPGERVLIHSASGGVGLAAIQLARRMGAEIFATAGSEEKREFLRQQGVEHIANSRTLDFADEFLRKTDGKGVDMILNSLAGEAIPRGIEILADYGRFLEIGKRDIYRNLHVGLRPFRNNLSFFGIDLDQLMQNRPELLGSILRSVCDEFDQGRLQPLPQQVFPAARALDAFRSMQQGKHIGKIVISMDQRPECVHVGNAETIRFQGDASYLITGGLGGFGSALARWMIDRGARHLVLMGRRPVDTKAVEDVVAGLQSPGVNVIALQGDVTRADDVEEVLDVIQQSHPPLRGVFHAAMVLEDGVLQNLDDDWMRRVMGSKVQGGWNLHEQTKDLELDHFVLFSSVSSIFGHPGQGSYAAANAFLDQLAHHRRSASLPCLTVNWGFLGDVGYLAERPHLGERLNRQGILSFTVRQALDCLERALLEQRTQLSVINIDWRRWRGLGLAGSISRRFRHLVNHEEDSAEAMRGGKWSVASLRELPSPQRIDIVSEMLSEKVSQVLGVSTDRLDCNVPLLDLGLDSLMAVELRNWIESRMQINLPIVELVRSPSLTHVAEELCDKIASDDVPVSDSPPLSTTSAVPDESPTMNPRELLANLEQLSGQEVDDLLAAFLDGTQGSNT